MDISLQKINTSQNNQDYSGTILYLHYPNYKNHTKNTFSGELGDIWDNSETNTCATLASDVAMKFRNPNDKKGNFLTGVGELFNNHDGYNILSEIMTIIPYTSHNYNAEIRNMGDETFYFDEP